MDEPISRYTLPAPSEPTTRTYTKSRKETGQAFIGLPSSFCIVLKDGLHSMDEENALGPIHGTLQSAPSGELNGKPAPGV